MTAPTLGPDAVARDEVGEVAIPDAAVEAMSDLLYDLHEDNRMGAAEFAAAVVRDFIPHLTTQPDGDVRTDLARLIRDVVEAGADWPFVADAVLASGHVVPVGEVEQLAAQVDSLTQLLADLMPSRTMDLAAQRDAANERADRAEAQVAAVRAIVDGTGWMDESTGRGVVDTDAIRAALDTAPASPTADQRIEARRLSGVHVGKVVELPDGWGGVINDVRHHGRVHGFRVDIGLRKVTLDGVPFHGDQHTNTAPSDVVTLIGGEE